jgi:hypothetical protein
LAINRIGKVSMPIRLIANDLPLVFGAPLNQRSPFAPLSGRMGLQVEHPQDEDGERAAAALKGIEGKRLTYRISNKTPHEQAAC